MKHIYNNFKVDHKGLELKDALWRCAGATTIREFERRMQELKDLDVRHVSILLTSTLHNSVSLTLVVKLCVIV